MGDVHECTLLDLGVALRYPGAKALCVQVGMPGEHQVDCVNDVVQEIGLICGVAVGAGENHPIGAAGREHIHRSRPEVGKQTAPGATVSRRLAVQHTLVDRLMVASLNGPIELWVALRLEGRIAVKGSGEIQQSKPPQPQSQGAECSHWSSVSTATAICVAPMPGMS